MTYRFEAAARIAAERAVAVIRSATPEEALEKARASLRGGVTVLEVALTTPGGVEVIERLAKESNGLPVPPLLGAGTVLGAEAAGAAIRAGARFLVSPGLLPDVVRTAARHGVAALPGAGTITEIIEALELGADLVKVFPAEVLGIAFVKAAKPVLPQAGLVPTGGVTAANAADWLKAGAAAVGVGGWLTGGRPDEVEARARELVKAVR